MNARPCLKTLLICALLAPAAAHATSSGWVDESGARIRLVAAEPAPDASEIRAVLEIELKPGWKTYWRDPGAAGVPPRLSFEGSSNIGASTLHFPVPERFAEGKSISTGYKKPVSFPFTLQMMTPGTASVVKANAFLGICEEICVPVQVNLAVDVPVANASTADQALVDTFFSQLPKPALPGFQIASAKRNGKSLKVMIETPTNGKEPALFLAAEGYLLGVPEPAGSGGSAREYDVPIIFEPKTAPLDSDNLHYTLVSGDDAVSGTARLAAQ